MYLKSYKFTYHTEEHPHFFTANTSLVDDVSNTCHLQLYHIHTEFCDTKPQKTRPMLYADSSSETVKKATPPSPLLLQHR